MSTLTIVLIVLGAMTVLGGGACVVIGGLVYLGAKAEAEGAAADPSLPNGTSTATPSTPPTATEPPPAPVPPEMADDDGSNEDGLGGGDDDDDRSLADNAPNDGASSGNGSKTGGNGSKTGGTKWFCNATGWVRVCGFANVCSNQMVSGIGSGTDRFVASQSAKIACEGMARAKGGSTVCAVSCTPR